MLVYPFRARVALSKGTVDMSASTPWTKVSELAEMTVIIVEILTCLHLSTMGVLRPATPMIWKDLLRTSFLLVVT